MSGEQRAVGVSDLFEIVPDDHEQSEGATYRQVMANTLYLLWLRRFLEDGVFDARSQGPVRVRSTSHLMNTAWDYAESEYELRDMLREVE